MRRRSAVKGIALLIPIVLLTWVIVPNVRRAQNRSRQQRTMADMRLIATAWEARATVINSYSVGSAHSDIAARPVTVDELARALEPTYIPKFPRTDAWGTEFQFNTAEYDGSAARTYVIRSLGSDARADRIADLSGPTTNFSDDIVYSNGTFVRYPESAG